MGAAHAPPTRLLQAGVVDFRVLTDLLVDLNVDKRVCPAPNVLSNVYQGDVAQKCAAATALLGDSKMGFGIKPPVLPRALLTADAAQRAKWSEPQQAWYNQLVEHARALSDCIRESRSSWEQRGTALTTVFKLINVEEVTKLWPEPQQRTSTWKDLLTPTTAILHSGPREERQRLRTGEWSVVPQHTYRLRLTCVNAEVSFVVACCIANYALLPREEEKAYDSLRATLADGKAKASVAEAETSASESSSDGESEWQIKKSRRDAARQRKRAARRSKQLAAFAAKELSGDRFTTDSANPLLQLATRVTTLRSWHLHFLECFVSNWETVGCAASFEMEEASFRRVVSALPELQDPRAVHWYLRQQVGGTLVSLFVREDLLRHLPNINTVLRQQPDLSQAALKLVCDMQARRTRERTRYCLNPDDTAASGRQVGSSPLPPTRARNTPPLPSWVAAVSGGRPVAVPAARRPAPSGALDHRPHKEQRRATPTASSPPPTPVTAAKLVAPASPAPNQWEARMAALEARFSRFDSALMDRLGRLESEVGSLRDLPRMVTSIQHQLSGAAVQSASRSMSSTPSQPLSDAPAAQVTREDIAVIHLREWMRGWTERAMRGPPRRGMTLAADFTWSTFMPRCCCMFDLLCNLRLPLRLTTPNTRNQQLAVMKSEGGEGRPRYPCSTCPAVCSCQISRQKDEK